MGWLVSDDRPPGLTCHRRLRLLGAGKGADFRLVMLYVRHSYVTSPHHVDSAWIYAVDGQRKAVCRGAWEVETVDPTMHAGEPAADLIADVRQLLSHTTILYWPHMLSADTGVACFTAALLVLIHVAGMTTC